MNDHYSNWILLISIIILINSLYLESAIGQEDYALDILDSGITDKIILKDDSLVVEKFVSGLSWPTALDFIGEDLFVLEKNSGNILLIRDGKIVDEPVLKIDVSNGKEEGLLGILTRDTTAYIHYTTRNPDDGTTSNWFYKYHWNGETFTEPTLLKQIHGGTEAHNSGPMILHSDGKIYGTVGDLNNRKGILQNYLAGDPDYTSSIFALEENNSYYAIGIRNSFGLALDHITGNMWITENGPESMDEINLIHAGFNGGWASIIGPATGKQINELPDSEFVYSDPKFSWKKPVSPTAISFIKSEKFERYHNSVLVGDFNTGTLYEFKLNNERTGFVFQNEELMDLVLDEKDFSSEIVLATGFLGITDIQEGPDGELYVLSIGDGVIYRIKSSEVTQMNDNRCDLALKAGMNLARCDLSGMNLQGINLSDSDLSFTNLQNTNLENSNLRGSILAGSDLRGSILSGSDLSYTDLSMSTFNKIKFNDVNLKNSNLRSSSFIDAEILNADFSFSDLDHINFEGATIKNSKLENVNLNRGYLKDAKLENVQIKDSYIDHATFNNAILQDVDLSNSIIWVTDFSNSNLGGSLLIETDIYDTKFFETDLENVGFQNSKIGNSYFDGANLSGANFLDVYPFETSFEDVIISDLTKIDSCLEHDLFSRIINKVLRDIRDGNLAFLSFIEPSIIKLCAV